MGCILRSLPGTVPDSNFSLPVVQVKHDCISKMRKQASSVIDIYLYTVYVYLCSIFQCNLHCSTCRLL